MQKSYFYNLYIEIKSFLYNKLSLKTKFRFFFLIIFLLTTLLIYFVNELSFEVRNASLHLRNRVVPLADTLMQLTETIDHLERYIVKLPQSPSLNDSITQVMGELTRWQEKFPAPTGIFILLKLKVGYFQIKISQAALEEEISLLETDLAETWESVAAYRNWISKQLTLSHQQYISELDQVEQTAAGMEQYVFLFFIVWFALFLLISSRGTSRLLNPLNEIAEKLSSMKEIGQKIAINTISGIEIRKIIRYFNQYQNQSETVLKEYKEKIKHQQLKFVAISEKCQQSIVSFNQKWEITSINKSAQLFFQKKEMESPYYLNQLDYSFYTSARKLIETNQLNHSVEIELENRGKVDLTIVHCFQGHYSEYLVFFESEEVYGQDH